MLVGDTTVRPTDSEGDCICFCGDAAISQKSLLLNNTSSSFLLTKAVALFITLLEVTIDHRTLCRVTSFKK